MNTSNKNETPNALTRKDLIDIATGFQKSQVLYVASSLGVFDELKSISGWQSAAIVAGRLGLALDSTERLLNACAAMSLITRTKDGSGSAVFRNNTGIEMYLIKSGHVSLRPLIIQLGDQIYSVFGQLKNAIEGKSPTDGDFSNGIWSFDNGSGFYSSPTKQLQFLHSMDWLSKVDLNIVINAFDLSPFKSACDIGGGTGALGLALATAYPTMNVTVFDLDHVISVLHHFLPSRKPANVFYEAGDFFKDRIPQSDLFVLSRIVHNWDQNHLDILLKKLYDSLMPGGAILVLEKVLNEAKSGPVSTLFLDLAMLVSVGGRERTAAEYRSLLERHGFVDVEVRLLPESPHRDAILAWKPRHQ